MKIEQPSSEAQKVTAAFNTVAAIYDESFNVSPVVYRLRSKVYHAIESRKQPPASILDINCGTGIDAMYFAGKGMEVTGIDISSNMIGQCRQKAEKLQLKNLKFYVISYEHLSQNLNGAFDLVLSNFGGLNCVENLDMVANQLSALTKQGSYFIAVVMPPFSLWDMITGVIKGKWNYAFRRLRKQVRATGFGNESFDVFYHSPNNFISAFKEWFTLEQMTGFNIVSPSPSSVGFAQRHRRLSSLLIQVDELIENIPIIRSAGDHYMLVMRRK